MAEKIGNVIERMAAELANPTPEQIARDKAREAERAMRDEDEARLRWRMNLGDLINRAGVRYTNCTLENFKYHGDAREVARQKSVVGALVDVSKRLRDFIAAGGNLILYGPPGTGKDHLLIGVARAAIELADATVRFRNGMDLYGEFRDAIKREREESDVMSNYLSQSVLVLSDPVPPRGELTSYAASCLYRLVNKRYERCKSTWVSLNVANGAEAAELLTPQVFDRLLDGGVELFCNWPSFRQKRSWQ